jgi:hypothetical protein
MRMMWFKVTVLSWFALNKSNTGRWACLYLTVTALGAGGLFGCFPYPVPSGPLKDSRTNVPSHVPSWIVTGRTTRRELLLELGEPDGRGPGERWYSYGSAISHGGVGGLLVIPSEAGVGGGYASHEIVEVRRLIVTFDEGGIVRDAKLDAKRCPSWSTHGDLGISHVTVPCLDIRGSDMDEQGRAIGAIEHENVPGSDAGATANTAESALARYGQVAYAAGVDCRSLRPMVPVVGELQILADALLLSNPGRQSQRTALIEQPPARNRVAIVDLRSIELVSSTFSSSRIYLHLMDGTCAMMEFYGWSQKANASAAAKLIEAQIAREP